VHILEVLPRGSGSSQTRLGAPPRRLGARNRKIVSEFRYQKGGPGVGGGVEPLLAGFEWNLAVWAAVGACLSSMID
jgi:hypothetical protein